LDYGSEKEENKTVSINDEDEEVADREWLVGYTYPDNWTCVNEDNIDTLELPTIEKIPYQP
jgi:hypothetical protein